ncbi:histidine phosphatase family protein [Marinomonas transparens]|uniref:phosphoglycerate mutase (2,3-diphosphoglycerate-dependent) n=1 Tax=Marinomonas transparens TaxID=2795388 RepID=A0A934JR87_9GAMM|nr:histidine phosphatase family protein [Marinomonas transparens]MBJ7538589.1 histidine phosphatase family protein [Marinomonas transparens]
MSRVCALIRHGAYEQLSNVPSALQPFPLTDSGELEVREQARAFGCWLRETGQKLDPVIDTSTLLRAWQTGQIYLEELQDFFLAKPQLRSFSALCERSVGAVANLTITEIERVLALDPRFTTPPKHWKSNSDYKLPFDGAESLLEAGERVARHVLAWRDSTSQGVKLIVGHGAAIRHGAFHLNLMTMGDIKGLSMFYGHPVVFEFVDNQPTRKRFGDWKQRHILNMNQDVPD